MMDLWGEKNRDGVIQQSNSTQRAGLQHYPLLVR